MRRDGEESFDSDLDVDQEVWQPESIKAFSSQISQFKIENDLDRKLLLGVLVRDSKMKDARRSGARPTASPSEIHHEDIEDVEDISILENTHDRVRISKI